MTDEMPTLTDGEKVEALVKISVYEMLEKPRQFLTDFFAMTALGKENIGTFYLDEFIIDPVGMIHKEIIFEVSGFARKHETPLKKKKSIKKKKTNKKKT